MALGNKEDQCPWPQGHEDGESGGTRAAPRKFP